MLLPWLWFRFHETAYLVYALAINIFFWIASIPEVKLYLEYKREGAFDTTGRFKSLENPFAFGPLITFVRRLRVKKVPKGKL